MDEPLHRISILVISPLRLGTGNATTSDRLKTSLEARGYKVDVVAPENVNANWLRAKDDHTKDDWLSTNVGKTENNGAKNGTNDHRLEKSQPKDEIRGYQFAFLIHALKR